MNLALQNAKIPTRSVMRHLEELVSLVSQFSHKNTEITSSTSFEELGMDSYEVVDFLVQVEKQFNIFIEEDKMLELKTIQDVAETLDQCNQEEN